MFNGLMSKPHYEKQPKTDGALPCRSGADPGAKIIRKQHDRRQEPHRTDEHRRLEELMQAMLFDIQRMIGCETMRQLQNFTHDNAIREGRL